MLRAETTAFVIVASPQSTSLSDASFLRDDLAARGVPLRAVVFNRGFVTEPGHPDQRVHVESADPHASAAIRAVRRAFVEENVVRERAMRAFLEGLGDATEALATPELDDDVRDVGTLAAMLAYTVGLRDA
jgi:anion-transporting  ArsA/GET3 family ATPase